MSSLGERLRKARERKNLTQVAVREKTGINNKTLSGYEKGISEPDIDTLKKLADLYEVSVDWLAGYDVKNKNSPFLTNEKKKRIMELYDQLPEDQQRILDQMAEIMLREKNKKGDEYK